VSWDPDSHWQHAMPTPQVTWTPSVSGSASFDGTAAFTFAPSISLHANQLFTYTVALTPNLHMEVQGDASTRQLCETTSYDVALTSEAELHLNIDWLHVHDDKTWGPKTIWATKGDLSQTCVKAFG